MSKKFKSVLVFGDSHFAGCELTPEEKLFEDYVMGRITIEEAEVRSKALAFPAIIAEKLDIPVYNFAMSGGSNDRGLRLLPEKVIEYPDSLILFGWTNTDRAEFYYPEHDVVLGRDKDLYAQVGMQWYDWPLNDTTAKYKIKSPINNLFVEELLFIDPKDDTKVVNQMLYVDLLCKKYCLDYRHIFTKWNVLTGKHATVFDLVDKTKILNCQMKHNLGYGCYEDWCKDRGHAMLELGHFDRKAHEDFAEFLFKDLTS